MNDWTYILLSHPEMNVLRLPLQGEPRKFLHMALPDYQHLKNQVVFTLIGQEKQDHIAFYVYGSWDFGDPKTFFERSVENQVIGPTESEDDADVQS